MWSVYRKKRRHTHTHIWKMLVVLWSIFTERKGKHTNTHKRWWIYCGLFSQKEKKKNTNTQDGGSIVIYFHWKKRKTHVKDGGSIVVYFHRKKRKTHTNTHKRCWVYCSLISQKDKENTHTHIYTASLTLSLPASIFNNNIPNIFMCDVQ